MKSHNMTSDNVMTWRHMSGRHVTSHDMTSHDVKSWRHDTTSRDVICHDVTWCHMTSWWHYKTWRHMTSRDTWSHTPCQRTNQSPTGLYCYQFISLLNRRAFCCIALSLQENIALTVINRFSVVSRIESKLFLANRNVLRSHSLHFCSLRLFHWL